MLEVPACRFANQPAQYPAVSVHEYGSGQEHQTADKSYRLQRRPPVLQLYCMRMW